MGGGPNICKIKPERMQLGQSPAGGLQSTVYLAELVLFSCRLKANFGNQRSPLAVSLLSYTHLSLRNPLSFESSLKEKERCRSVLPLLSYQLPEMGQFKSRDTEEAKSQPGFFIYEENKACQRSHGLPAWTGMESLQDSNPAISCGFIHAAVIVDTDDLTLSGH